MARWFYARGAGLFIGFAIAMAATPPTLAPPAAAQETVRQGAPPGYASMRFGQAWPKTDFSRADVDLREILAGGPPRDGIPAIDRPRFVPAAAADHLAGNEAVITLSLGGEARAYPLQVLMWHEIANDTVGGIPVAVTYCPLCNSAVAFERRLDGQVLDFGVSGLLRHSDMVMYDRQTESWWQQFLGKAIVGELVGAQLKLLPVRVESFARFRERFPDGQVLQPPSGTMRDYGRNPYLQYDSRQEPYFPMGYYDDPLPAMARVVAVGEEAWPLSLLRERGRIEAGDLVLTWTPGQASALDASTVAGGRDIGNVVVQRRQADGRLADEVYDVTFAFAFRSFRPEGILHPAEGQ